MVQLEVAEEASAEGEDLAVAMEEGMGEDMALLVAVEEERIEVDSVDVEEVMHPTEWSGNCDNSGDTGAHT